MISIKDPPFSETSNVWPYFSSFKDVFLLVMQFSGGNKKRAFSKLIVCSLPSHLSFHLLFVHGALMSSGNDTLPCTAAFSLSWSCINFLLYPDLPWELSSDFSIVLHIVNVIHYFQVDFSVKTDIPDSASFPPSLSHTHQHAHSPDSLTVDKITVFPLRAKK